MAGIGFRLKKPLAKGSYLGLIQAYGYAGVISSGPWVLSILGVLLVSFLVATTPPFRMNITQFQVSVTYLIAFSLIFSGLMHLVFTRFVADRLFERKKHVVLPNFMGVLYVVSLASAGVALPLVILFFPNESVAYRTLMLMGFIILCNVWIATLLLSGLKVYVGILACFAIGYATSVAGAYLLRDYGLEGLLAGFIFGQFVLFTGMIWLILRDHAADRLMAFDFFSPAQTHFSLVWSGVFYALAIWIDKILFWFHPATGYSVLGPLRASHIYDLPMFLAYLTIIPGMGVFLLRIETDFVEYYERFYDAVREHGSLTHIQEMRDELVFAARQGITEVIKIQAITVLVAIVFIPWLWRRFGFGELYLPLLYVDLVSVALQVVFLALLNVFFYLDERMTAVGLTALFLLSNGLLSYESLLLGSPFYGYGLAASVLISVVVGMLLLDHLLERLEYETFMLQ